MAINYNKVGWNTTSYVNPTNMNQMDNGIKAACDGVDAIDETIGDTSTLPSPSDDICTNISEVNSNLAPTKFTAFQYFVNQSGWHLSTSAPFHITDNYRVTYGTIIGVRTLTNEELEVLNSTMIKSNYSFRWWTNNSAFTPFDGKMLELVYTKQ